LAFSRTVAVTEMSLPGKRPGALVVGRRHAAVYFRMIRTSRESDMKVKTAGKEYIDKQFSN